MFTCTNPFKGCLPSTLIDSRDHSTLTNPAVRDFPLLQAMQDAVAAGLPKLTFDCSPMWYTEFVGEVEEAFGKRKRQRAKEIPGRDETE